MIFRQQPDKKGDAHSGGRMAFLSDHTLLLTVSDGYDYKEEAQNLATDFGSVVRLTRDGEVPDDNPFSARDGARPEIYSYGHRNALGLLRDPRDGSIWLHENGPKGGDEINRLRAGANYGWPKTCYGIDYSGEQITKLQRADGIEDPVVVWVPSIAPSGFALYLGDQFPQWRGDFFVGALTERSIRRVRIVDNVWTEQQILLRELNARIRDVRAGPDGYLYALTDADSGAILRLYRRRARRTDRYERACSGGFTNLRVTRSLSPGTRSRRFNPSVSPALSLPDHPLRHVGTLPVADLDPLAGLEILVVLEEVLDLLQRDRRQIGVAADAVVAPGERV